MKYWNACGTMVFVLIWLVPVRLFASGYSEYQNHRIWQLRLAAGQYASHEAQKTCAWAPESPTTFSDQMPRPEKVSHERLFLNLMAMIRLDQNARAISGALHYDDSVAEDKVREVDSENLRALKRIFSKYGFPTVDEVSESGVNAMLLLVAHADEDVEFQKSVARTMDREVAEGKLPAIYPTILKAIRPNTIDKTMDSGNGSSDSEEAHADSSPRACYSHKYNDLLDSYIRDHWAIGRAD